MQAESIILDIKTEDDIVLARTRGKSMAQGLGFGMVDQTRIATGISELTRNILQYAGEGTLTLRPIHEPGRGMVIEADDSGPGIPDLGAILEGRGKPSRGLGLGLPGTRRLMDEFDVKAEAGRGTHVRCVKWLH